MRAEDRAPFTTLPPLLAAFLTALTKCPGRSQTRRSRLCQSCWGGHLRRLVTLHLWAGNRKWWGLVLSSLPPFYSVQVPQPVRWCYPVTVGLSCLSLPNLENPSQARLLGNTRSSQVDKKRINKTWTIITCLKLRTHRWLSISEMIPSWPTWQSCFCSSLFDPWHYS